jgi:drug/metabolite transporter (DMT)-like permease
MSWGLTQRSWEGEEQGYYKRGGHVARFMYPLFLGCAPVLGKMAINGGSDPFTVAALRTVAAALILWVVTLLFWRKYVFIYPAGLVGCVVVGVVNGIGSLFYYNGLSYLSASVAQLLNSTYLIFVVLLALASGQPVTRRLIVRVVLAFSGVILITQGVAGDISWLGTGLMLANAICFAGTFILSQRVLYEMPARTVALYVLTTMAVVVVMARAVYRLEWVPQSGEAAGAILLLGLTTALSRITMFFNVKKMGSIQTVLVGISETAIALVLAFFVLGDQLRPLQWVGVGILLLGLLLVKYRHLDKHATGEMPVFQMQGLLSTSNSFNRIAFIKAFGEKQSGPPDTEASPDIDDVTPEEMEMIRRMMQAPPRYE